MNSTVSQKGVDLIKKWEGLRLKAYKDSGGIWTIGYGSTKVDGKPVVQGQVITEAEAERQLMTGINRHINGALLAIYQDIKLNQNQVDALAAFVYNVGVGAFQKSTMCKLINENKFDAAGAQFIRWNKVNGKEVAGLTNRRKEEAKLWSTKIT